MNIGGDERCQIRLKTSGIGHMPVEIQKIVAGISFDRDENAFYLMNVDSDVSINGFRINEADKLIGEGIIDINGFSIDFQVLPQAANEEESEFPVDIDTKL